MSISSPELDAPRAIQKALLEHGGMVPGRDIAMWRLVLAQNCLIKASGILHELPTGEVSRLPFLQMGDGYIRSLLTGFNQARSDLPKYPCEGWVLEKWFPASTWGTREEWASHRSEDGSTIMGAYPSEGDYWMLAGPFERILELADLRQSIDMRTGRP